MKSTQTFILYNNILIILFISVLFCFSLIKMHERSYFYKKAYFFMFWQKYEVFYT